VFVSVLSWRRGASGLTLAPITAACVFGVVIVYGLIAPAENEKRSHRAIAQRIRAALPSHVGTLMFFNEIDEGLWFYLSGIDLVPIPGSHPRYNVAYDLANSYLTERRPFETISDLEAKRQARDRQTLLNWLEQNGTGPCYVLFRSRLYDLVADAVDGRAVP